MFYEYNVHNDNHIWTHLYSTDPQNTKFHLKFRVLVGLQNIIKSK